MLSDCIPFIFGICLYNCNTTKEIFMNISTDAFFETNFYPKPYHQDLDKCNITFVFDNPDKEVQIIVFKTELFYDDHDKIFKNITTWETYFTKTYSFKDHYTKKSDVAYFSYAQFGYISFEPKDLPRCTIETTKPIFIFSEYELIFIQSDFLYLNIPSDSCHWKFSTSEDYGFKVVIQYFEPTFISALEIKNSTDTYVNYRSAKINHPCYNSDNYLEINVFKNLNLTFRAFEASISVVKKTKKILNKCNVTTDRDGFIEWNINTLPIMFNIYCSYNLIISNTDTEYDVSVANFPLERNVDFLRYTYNEVDGVNTTVYIDGNVGEVTKFTLFGYPNGTDRIYFWEYELDGSFPSLGDKVYFSRIQCHCIGKSIPCTAADGNQPTGIMERTQYRYCGNLRCNFTLEPCVVTNRSNSFNVTVIKLHIVRTDYNLTRQVDGNADIFTIYSDDAVVLHLELNTFNIYENDYILFLNNSKTNIFEVKTSPARLSKSLYLETYELKDYPFLFNVNLTSDEPFVVIDTGLYVLNTIKIRNFKSNDSIILYSNTARGIPLYKNENLQVSYNDRKCFGNLYPYQCNLTTDEFAIYVPNMVLPLPLLIIQTSDYYQKGCVFNTNIFIIEKINHMPITIIANSEDACIARILFVFDTYKPNYYFISSYWTNAKNENVKIFAGTDNLYFEFNSKTSNKYTRIELFSFFYTIKVPKMSTVYLQLKEAISVEYDFDYGIYEPAIPKIYITQNNYISIFSTAYFGTSKGSWGIKKVYYCFPLRKIKFTTIYFSIEKNEDFWFFSKNGITRQFRIKQNGETFIFDNRLTKNQTSILDCVLLQYSPAIYSSPTKNGIVFKIETIDDNDDNIFLT